MTTVLYRVRDSGDFLHLQRYDVVKTTPCGFWIWFPQENRRKFVLSNTRKCFAHATVEAALESFYHRKKSQLKIISHQVEVIKGIVNDIETNKDAVLLHLSQNVGYTVDQISYLFGDY